MYKKYLKYFDYPRDIQVLLSKIKIIVPQLKFPTLDTDEPFFQEIF